MKLLSLLIALALLLHPGSVLATEMPSQQRNTETQFERVEQPPVIRAIVTLGGISLIGLELWWFLFSKSKANND
jgi:plastocyanin domain-containing protein